MSLGTSVTEASFCNIFDGPQNSIQVFRFKVESLAIKTLKFEIWPFTEALLRPRKYIFSFVILLYQFFPRPNGPLFRSKSMPFYRMII